MDAGAPADGKSLQSLCMEAETGFYLLAIRPGGAGTSTGAGRRWCSERATT